MSSETITQNSSTIAPSASNDSPTTQSNQNPSETKSGSPLPIGSTPISPTKAIRIMVVKFVYGGLHPETDGCFTRDIVHHLTDPDCSYELHISAAYNDALIDRARSSVSEGFLRSGFEVMVMVDHDLSWGQGDLLRIAKKAHELQAIVGAAVSKRNRGDGIASRIIETGIMGVGTDRLAAADFVGGAFTAYPRKIVEAVFNTMRQTTQGFRPGFLPATTPDTNDPTKDFYLSEDWAFCKRALDLGFKCYVDLLPKIGHWGVKCWTVADAYEGVKKEDFVKPPKFALLHATRGRAKQAMQIRNVWLERASGQHDIEYIYSLDNDDPQPLPTDGIPDGTRVIFGENRGNVDAYNRAAYDASTDCKIFIQVHDDVDPPKNWDKEIIKRIGNWDEPKVLQVSDGLDQSINSKPWLLTILIGTRAWFESVGYFYHPEFVSVFCDDHASRLAAKYGVVADGKDLVFKHNWEGPERDETQKKSYAEENWKIGEAAMVKLEAEGMKKQPELWRSL